MFNKLRKRFFRQEQTVSKTRAMSRLHFVLVQDRTGLTATEMASFKSELMAVLEKYFIVDKQGFDVDYKRDAVSTTLLINSPVVVRRQEVPSGNATTEKSKTTKEKNSKSDKDTKEVASEKNEKSEKSEKSDKTEKIEKTEKATKESKEKDKKADAVANA